LVGEGLCLGSLGFGDILGRAHDANHYPTLVSDRLQNGPDQTGLRCLPGRFGTSPPPAHHSNGLPGRLPKHVPGKLLDFGLSRLGHEGLTSSTWCWERPRANSAEVRSIRLGKRRGYARDSLGVGSSLSDSTAFSIFDSFPGPDLKCRWRAESNRNVTQCRRRGGRSSWRMDSEAQSAMGEGLYNAARSGI
jgi:hypothetical protein